MDSYFRGCARSCGLLCLIFALHLSRFVLAELKDYCLDESFVAECQENQIVLIENARYGRMRLGRCAERDYGYIGCASNVTRILSSRCSGRRQCTVVNFETLFAGEQTCEVDLKAYLEADYSCVNVTTNTKDQCQRQGEVQVTAPSGLLTSSVAQELDIGSELCPWHLVAEEGQRFELSLWDFADYTKRDTSSASSNPRYCRIYAFISEERYGAMKDVVACNGQPATQHVYTSRGHDVRVKFVVTPGADQVDAYYFAIKYKVLGCVLPRTPSNSHFVDHLNGSVTVQCNSTGQGFMVHCSASGQYIGNIGNCSKNTGAFAGDKEDGHFLSYGVAVVIIITVAILICALILTFGLVHYKRRRRFDNRGHHVRLRHASSAPDAAEMKQMRTFASAVQGHCNSLPATPKKRYAVERSPMTKAKTLGRTHSLNRGEYAHIWEIRRPIPVATPKVPPAGERSDPDGTPRSRSMERQPLDGAGADDFPLPPNTFMTFKPLGDHVYESPRFASLSKSGSRSPARGAVFFDTCTRDGKPIPPRRSLDQGDRNRLRTMGLGGTIQRVRYVPEPNPSEEGKISV